MPLNIGGGEASEEPGPPSPVADPPFVPPSQPEDISEEIIIIEEEV